MIKKALVLAAGVGGYVLGTRAGRGRYEQIKTQADKVWSSPTVQKVASDAQDLAAEKAPVVKEKATAAAHRATGTAKEAADEARSKVAEKAPSSDSGQAPSKDGQSTDDHLEGIDLVAAASDVPEEPKHG
ncbi:MAG: YtxH domain-containing protein [Actinomycetales bacterium]|nr:MAG: YtxH domain-containing protein [Actinomycetales bacterium]